MLIALVAAIAGDSVVETTLNAGPGGTKQKLDPNSPWNSSVSIRFKTDGTIEIDVGAGYVDVGDWITPVDRADNAYDVRFTNFNGAGGGDWTSEAAADNVWVDLGTTRTWTMASAVEESISFTCDFEVRDGGGAPPATDSSSYTFNIENTSA